MIPTANLPLQRRLLPFTASSDWRSGRCGSFSNIYCSRGRRPARRPRCIAVLQVASSTCASSDHPVRPSQTSRQPREACAEELFLPADRPPAQILSFRPSPLRSGGTVPSRGVVVDHPPPAFQPLTGSWHVKSPAVRSARPSASHEELTRHAQSCATSFLGGPPVQEGRRSRSPARPALSPSSPFPAFSLLSSVEAFRHGAVADAAAVAALIGRLFRSDAPSPSAPAATERR